MRDTDEPQFGIFAVAWGARRTNHTFVIRLTDSRFKARHRQATIVTHDENSIAYSLTWQPSAS